MLSLKEGKTMARKIVKITKKQSQSLVAFQGKEEVRLWLRNLVNKYAIKGQDIKIILDALLDSPFLGYEPIGQVAYNEPKIIEVLNRYQAQR